MTKIVTGEYDAAAKTLRLDEPLEGVSDHEKVTVTVTPSNASETEPAWMKLRGSWSKERGEEFARIMEEMFPPWNRDE